MRDRTTGPPDFFPPRSSERFGRGVVVSTLAHGGIVVALVIAATGTSDVMRNIGGSAGPRGGGGGGGGAAVQYVSLPPLEWSGPRTSAPADETPPEQPELQLPRPTVAPVLVSEPVAESRGLRGQVELASVEGAGPGTGGGPGAGSGRGGGVGTGQGTGVGTGEGPGTGGGEGGSVLPPEPRFTLMPLHSDRPASVRGREFAVHFWVDQRGRVTRIEIDPQIADAEYRKRFLEEMRQFTFTPARTLDGRPVDGHIIIRISL